MVTRTEVHGSSTVIAVDLRQKIKSCASVPCFGTKLTTACVVVRRTQRSYHHRHHRHHRRGALGVFPGRPRTDQASCSPFRCTTSTERVQGSWSLQIGRGGSVARGIQRNGHEYRGADVVSRRSRHHRARAFDSCFLVWGSSSSGGGAGGRSHLLPALVI